MRVEGNYLHLRSFGVRLIREKELNGGSTVVVRGTERFCHRETRAEIKMRLLLTLMSRDSRNPPS